MAVIKSLLSRKLFWLAIIYGGLLIWSGVYRMNLPDPRVPKSKKSVSLQTVNGKQKLSERIRFTYLDYDTAAEVGTTPVILIHGSPGSAETFDDLAEYLKNRKIISVDLPGFGNSETDIPDYSILAHSLYLLELMDKLDIEKAHLVGFSLGGGVALHMADRSPERVESISFISSIGVQEYEIFGNYHLNHIVHGAQLGFFWILQELVPHFGIFDGPISYARNFYDTDQRPLRDILEEIEIPFQIIHGKDDPLVPVEAAREHARIVPQSEYNEMDDNHFFIFMRPEKIEESLQVFWSQAETGKATVRATAEPQRIVDAKKPFEGKILRVRGATAFVFFLLLAILAFLNEDFAYVLGGFCAAQGRFGLALAIIAGVFGSYVSIVFVTLLGRVVSNKASSSIPEVNGFISRVFLRKFFSFRFLDHFAAGKSRTQFWKYLFTAIFSSTFWTLVLVACAYFLVIGLAGISILDTQNTYVFLTAAGLLLISFNVYRIFRYQR